MMIMVKLPAKQQIFGVPSIETVARVDNSDKCNAFAAAHYRLQENMRGLETAFEAKASELRAAFVQEVSAITMEAAE
jgi:hypothetical protein